MTKLNPVAHRKSVYETRRWQGKKQRGRQLSMASSAARVGFDDTTMASPFLQSDQWAIKPRECLRCGPAAIAMTPRPLMVDGKARRTSSPTKLTRTLSMTNQGVLRQQVKYPLTVSFAGPAMPDGDCTHRLTLLHLPLELHRRINIAPGSSIKLC